MATTTLSQFIEPIAFAAYVSQKTTALNVLLTSGAMARSAEFDARCSAPGPIGELPFFNPLAWSESNIGSDDPTQLSVPDNLSAGSMVYRKEYREKDWSYMELTASVMGLNLGQAIADRTAEYWNRELNAHALARLAGVAASSPEIVNNIGTDTTGAVTAAQSAGFGAVIDTLQTLGDHREAVTLVVMHSKVFSNLMKLEPTSFVAPSTVQPFRTYNGKQVLIDDSVTVTQGTNRSLYNTYFLGAGALVYGETQVPDAVEIWRNPAAGNGFGEERLYTRKQFLMQPTGYTVNQSVAPAARQRSLSLAQWAAAGTLQRVYDRKNVPIAILQSNA